MSNAPRRERIDQRYEVLEHLGEGGMGEVFRVRDRLDGVVALKRVLDRAEARAAWDAMRTSLAGDPTLGSMATALAGLDATAPVQRRRAPASANTARDPNRWRLVLAREFSVLASLRHPHIISVVDYGFDQELHPYFTMELLEGAKTIVEAGRVEPVEVRLRLVSELLQALAYLHRRGVVHRDLKPSNILVAGGRVKVLDFGIAIHEGETSPVPAGTLAYMAPELFLGQAPSAASDLYSVGLIAYELFKGRYPFDLGRVTPPAVQAMSEPVDLRGLDPDLAPFLGRLLAPDVRRRFASAGEALRALRGAARFRVQVESQETRESFLQAAELVGREDELRELHEALLRAKAGRGGGVLIAGESGVGKSRLLQELRVHALVMGATVAGGDEVSAGGGPYHVWLDVLRRLVLAVSPGPEEAAVLKPLLHEIEELLDSPVPDAPPLDPEAMQLRLLATILGLFERLGKPMLVLLDDLQWSGSESLKLLGRIARDANRLPLLLVGGFRDEEAPSLPAALPDMRVLKLKRLDAQATVALSVSMLGERGHDPDVLSLLVREAEGIPFLLVEAVRALAEEAGELGRVGIAALPSSVRSGGMARLVRRRLDRVPAWAAPLLRAAAVIGRKIDVALLRHIDPEMDLDRWLAACVEVAVLDVHDGAWRFSHDKLREGVLARLAGEENLRLHRAAAQAIEATYPGAPGRYRALARHWEEAGVLDRAVDYYEKAAEQALAEFGNREAIACFEKALSLDAASGGAAPAFRRGKWERGLADAHMGIGEQAAGILHAKAALGHFGQPMAESRLGCAAGILRQIPLRAVHSYLPAKKETSAEQRAFLREATATYSNLIQHFFLRGEPVEGAYCGLRALDLGERIDASEPLAYAYAFMSIVAGMGRMWGVADAWAARSETIAEGLGRGSTLAYCLGRTAVYSISRGKWAEAEPRIRRGVEIAHASGDRRCLEENWAISFIGFSHFGSLEEALSTADSEMRSASARGDDQILNWSRTHRIDCAARLGLGREHMAMCSELIPWLERAAGDSESVYAYGVMAEAALSAGDADRARTFADQALLRMKRNRPVPYFALNGLSGAANVYLTLAERGSADRFHLLENARIVCDVLDRFVRLVPIAEPSALRCRGRLLHANGDAARAVALYRKSLSAAAAMAMRFEQAQAHALLALHGPASERDDHEDNQAALLQAAGVTVARSGPATTRVRRAHAS
jgi:tetratricopeptide (TPR) repeat protein